MPRSMAVIAPLLLIALYTVVLSTTRPAQHPLKTTLEGQWHAEGIVEESHGDVIDDPQGAKLDRTWEFERRCKDGRCRLWFTRQALRGNETAVVTEQGNQLRAVFQVRTRGCNTARTGVITRRFQILAEPEYGRLTGHSTSSGTYPGCALGGRDARTAATLRWTARRAGT